MKKKFFGTLIIATTIIALGGCGTQPYQQNSRGTSDAMFYVKYAKEGVKILVDKDTKVNYIYVESDNGGYQGYGGLTPRLDENGQVIIGE